MTERDAALVLLTARGVGPSAAARLRESYGSLAAAVAALREERSAEVARRSRRPCVHARVGDAVRLALRSGEWEREKELAERAGARFAVAGDQDYPKVLSVTTGAPVGLFVMGDTLSGLVPAAGIVGTRAPTPRGVAFTADLAADLVGAGLTVVSGMARGIDTAAHRGAIDAGGRTIAVLGCGLARVYPPENAGLKDEIAGHGALVSEFPMRADPMPGSFPRRNRVISGLSAGVVVVEAASRSGALITAARALEQGREVFAVPGPVDEPLSAGPNGLIKAGAKLVEGVYDVLEELERAWGPFVRRAAEAGEHPGGCGSPSPGGPGDALPDAATSTGRRILAGLSLTPASVDELSASAGIPVPETLSSLLELELAGSAERLPGGRYVLGGRSRGRRRGRAQRASTRKSG